MTTTSPHAHLATLINGTPIGPNTIATTHGTLAFYFNGTVRLIPGGRVLGKVSDGAEALAAAFLAAVGERVAS